MKISDSLFFMWDLFKFFMSLVEAIKNLNRCEFEFFIWNKTRIFKR